MKDIDTSHRTDIVRSLSGRRLRSLAGVLLIGGMAIPAFGQGVPKFRHVSPESAAEHAVNDLPESLADEREKPEEDIIEAQPDSLLPRSVEEILASVPASYPYLRYPLKASGPWVISGYRALHSRQFSLPAADMKSILGRRSTTHDRLVAVAVVADTLSSATSDIVQIEPALSADSIAGEGTPEYALEWQYSYLSDDDLAELPPVAKGDYMPGWLREAIANDRMQDDAIYRVMMADPYTIEYARWDLPEPPSLPDDDRTFLGFLRKLPMPEIDPSKTVIEGESFGRRNWLHVLNTGLQFSQAYFSRNWYQGGTDYLSLLFNFLWDVSLNQVYHPNLMLQSVVSYKLGVSTTPRGSLHKYQISADAFQWNFKAGVKAYTKWFYSFTGQFKTQMLVSYPSDSDIRTASFLSPGEFNMGLGMTFNHANKNNTFKLSLSISPLSYNLKTCIDDNIDRTQFKITPPSRTVSEIGSNLELTYEWQLHSNILWRSRAFAFSDYKSLLGDWENTFEFAVNRFLSTQFYFHLRYDTSTPTTVHTGWGKWQFKEFLSLGFSYTFNTKP
ncbi:MAG: DUF3078 domain-containing protein [Bacteroidales bacterium]|nr:DUF3078 domain-containing protein [Bacteroidales bacterium]